MYFTLSAPEVNKMLKNTLCVKVFLRNGAAQIYPEHQDLIGKVENNLIEVQASNLDNKIEKFRYFLKDAVLLVSSKSLGSKDRNQTLDEKMGVSIYATKAYELNSELSKEKAAKLWEEKKAVYEKELEKYQSEIKTNQDLNAKQGFQPVSARLMTLSDDVDFFKRLFDIVKQYDL